MNQNIESVREVLVDIVTRRSATISTVNYTSFITLATKPRYLLLLTKSHIDSIWNIIRVNEILLDFTLAVTSEFLLRAFDEDFTYTQLCGKIGEVYDCIGNVNGSIDASVIKEIPKGDSITKVYLDNPWLTVLFLIEMIFAESRKEDEEK